MTAEKAPLEERVGTLEVKTKEGHADHEARLTLVECKVAELERIADDLRRRLDEVEATPYHQHALKAAKVAAIKAQLDAALEDCSTVTLPQVVPASPKK